MCVIFFPFLVYALSVDASGMQSSQREVLPQVLPNESHQTPNHRQPLFTHRSALRKWKETLTVLVNFGYLSLYLSLSISLSLPLFLSLSLPLFLSLYRYKQTHSYFSIL